MVLHFVNILNIFFFIVDNTPASSTPSSNTLPLTTTSKTTPIQSTSAPTTTASKRSNDAANKSGNDSANKGLEELDSLAQNLSDGKTSEP